LNLSHTMFCLLSTLNPPFTLPRAGRTGVVKLPLKSMAPPTSTKAGNEMAFKIVLLAIWSAPPMLFSAFILMLVKAVLATNAKLPDPVAKLPTEVRLGAEMLSTLDS